MKQLLLIISVLFLSGCNAATFGSPSSGTMISASSPAPQLRVITDPDLKVIGFYPDSPAEKAGMQLGDRLVEILPTDQTAEQRPDIPREPVPFTDRESFWGLLGQAVIPDEAAIATRTAQLLTPVPEGEVSPIEPNVYLPDTLPFLVRVEREGKIVELTVTPTFPVPSQYQNMPEYPEGSLVF